MKDYKKELNDYIKAKKEEMKLPENIEEILEDVFRYHLLEKRKNAIEEALHIFQQEGLSIDASSTERMAGFEKEMEQLRKSIHQHITWLLNEITPKQWFTLLALIEKNQTKEQFQHMIDCFNEPQKEEFYHLIRSIPLTQEESTLLRHFEERLQYSYAFIRRVQQKKEDEGLRIFEDYFEKYVPVYHPKMASTLHWLKTDVFSMHLNEALLGRYAESTVRRLEIGKDIPDLEEKKEVITHAILELKELLRLQQQMQQQKKSSK